MVGESTVPGDALARTGAATGCKRSNRVCSGALKCRQTEGFSGARHADKGEVGSSNLLGPTIASQAVRGFQRSIPTYSDDSGAVLARDRLCPRPRYRSPGLRSPYGGLKPNNARI